MPEDNTEDVHAVVCIEGSLHRLKNGRNWGAGTTPRVLTIGGLTKAEADAIEQLGGQKGREFEDALFAMGEAKGKAKS